MNAPITELQRPDSIEEGLWITLSPEEKLAAIESEMDAAREDDTPVPEKEIGGVTIQAASQGVIFAQKAVKDAEFVQLMHKYAEHSKEAKRGPWPLCVRLRTIYGTELDGTPFPDTDSADDDDKARWGNGPYDRYVIDGPVVEGKVTKIKGTFWYDFAAAFPEGRKLWEDREKIRSIPKNENGSFESPEAKDRAKKENAIDWSTYVGQVKKAAKLHHILRQIEMLPEVNLECDAPEDRTSIPFVVQNAKKLKQWANFSVPGIMRTDPWKASANGGTYAAFEATIKRPPKKVEPTDPTKAIPNGDVGQAESYLSRVDNFFDVRDNQSAFNKHLLTGKDRETAVRTFGSLYHYFHAADTDKVWLKIRPLYDKLLAQEESAETKGKAA